MEKPKMQATLDGYMAWAFTRLVAKTGEKNADVCKWVLREWLADHGDTLAGEFGISREIWEKEVQGNLRTFPKQTDGSQATESGGC